MDARVDPEAEASIGELFGRLVEDGRAVARTEAALYRQIAAYRFAKAKSGIAALVVAALLLNAALVVLLVGVALGLAAKVGPLGGSLVVVAAVAIIAFFLVRYGASKVKALSGDPEEKAALAAGERLA